MSIRTLASLAASFAARYPQANNQVDSISASADSTQIDAIEAAAVRGYGTVAGKLVWVKATMHFFMPGAETILEGDFLQVDEKTAQQLTSSQRAQLATDEEVAAAQKKGK